jgi:Alpha/beta hydrolase family
MSKRKLIFTILAGQALLLFIGATGFSIWAATPPEPMSTAIEALNSDAEVSITIDPWIVFTPQEPAPTCGFIFYPGGRVDPRSYAPAAHEIANSGIFSVIVPMPLNHAVFAPGKATQVIEAYPEINTWVIGGHSLGGSMAAYYAESNPASIDGLVLWASYPAASNDLSSLDVQVASIYGTLDGLISQQTIRDSLVLLPENTRLIPIDGGNHAQFGWYGSQSGDQPAGISRDDQQSQAVSATLDIFRDLGC